MKQNVKLPGDRDLAPQKQRIPIQIEDKDCTFGRNPDDDDNQSFYIFTQEKNKIEITVAALRSAFAFA